MAERAYWKESDANAAFDEFVAACVKSVNDGMPADFWLFLANCPACSAPLASFGLAPCIVGFTVSYPAMMLLLLHEIKENARQKQQPCPRCAGGIGESAYYKAYTGRTRALTHSALVGIWDLPMGEAPRAVVQILRPPDHWTDMGENPSPEAMMKEHGRTGHPLPVILQVLRDVTPDIRRPVQWISYDCAVTPFYGEANVRGEQEAMEGALAAAGLPGPYRMIVSHPGKKHPGFEAIGAQKPYEDLAGPLRAGVAQAFSLPRVAERIDDFARTYGVTIELDRPRLIATVRKGLKREKVDISELLQQAPAGFVTFDEMFHQAAFTDLEPKTAGAHAGSARPPPPIAAAQEPPPPAAAPTRGARLAPAVRQSYTGTMTRPPPAPPRARPPLVAAPPLAPAAPVVAPPSAATYVRSPAPTYSPPAVPGLAALAARPWRYCQRCGAQAILVRRIFDSVRLDSIYKPKPVLAHKTFSVNTVLMVSCGQHLVPVMPAQLAQWAITPEQLADEAAREMVHDTLRVRARYEKDKHGLPIIGFAGAFAASIATDPLWVESAIRKSSLNLPGIIKVECNGENVVTLRSKAAISAGAMPKELRKATKAWGLPEPRIGFSYSREVTRSAHAAGDVHIEGMV